MTTSPPIYTSQKIGSLAAHVAGALGTLKGCGQGDSAGAHSLAYVKVELMKMYEALLVQETTTKPDIQETPDVVEALKRLLAVKHHKEDVGKTLWYEEEMPKAWENARATIAAMGDAATARDGRKNDEMMTGHPSPANTPRTNSAEPELTGEVGRNASVGCSSEIRLLSECCDKDVTDKRYCPSCGWECRVKEVVQPVAAGEIWDDRLVRANIVSIIRKEWFDAVERDGDPARAVYDALCLYFRIPKPVPVVELVNNPNLEFTDPYCPTDKYTAETIKNVLKAAKVPYVD